MRFRWSLARPQPSGVAQLARELDVAPLLAQCLLNRGFTAPASAQAFLEPRLKHLADPFLVPNMQAAVDRLLAAHQRKETVVLFGDYDVDGVTSTTMLLEILRPLGWTVHWYLPHRFDEGYGLTREAVANCLGKYPATLLVAVDCGSTAVDCVTQLRRDGIDVIILDHHQVASPAPPATALVNPLAVNGSQADGGPVESGWTERRDLLDTPSPALPHPGQGSALPPYAELCSVGLAFKLAHALLKRGRETGLPGASEFDLKPLLDLVALGTVADIVPLVGENRILVSAGIERLAGTSRPGLVALKRVARCPQRVGPFEIGFQLAPRLNAAGRLQTAAQALSLLLAREPAEALRLAQELDTCNRERQTIERRIAEQAVAAVRARHKPETDFVIVEGHPEWHIGVVGIVASRLLQQFNRPTIVVGGEGGEWRGSGRSIPGFDLAAALRECHDLLVRHGGHAMAAGVTVAPNRFDAFRDRLNQVARRLLRPDQLLPELRLDGEVRLGDLTAETLNHLAKLMPTGPGNPAPQFCARGVRHQRPPQRLGTEQQHVKMWLADSAGAQEVVWWSAGDAALPRDTFDVAFVPQLNTYNGRTRVQLKLLDWQPGSTG